jgi:hypothetical protein
MTIETNTNIKVLGLVITDGVGYRNFILSNFLDGALKEFNKIIIYSGLPANSYEVLGNNIEIVELPVFTEPFPTWFWRKFKEIAHLQLHKKFFGIRDNLKANKSTSFSNKGISTKIIYLITHCFHNEGFIRYLEAKQERSVKNHMVTQKCIEVLKQTAPDVLFFTHQRPPYVLPLLVAARKSKIQSGVFIFSWDNLASKGRMAATFDFFYVWSKLMKKELLYFYPNSSKESVEIVGTPQFEPYVMPEYKLDKKSFFESFGLEHNKKTICYSCGDISTSKNDELYIEIIATALQAEKINNNLNFIVRTSPAEEPDRFVALKEKFPFIRWNFPKWKISRTDHPEVWSQRVPDRNDLIELRALLEYSDIGINMCSTMSLDFMLFNKPVINPVFGNEENAFYNDQRFLKFGHYKRVVSSKAVKIAKNKMELIDAINFYLQQPQINSNERRKLLELQIGKPLKGTSTRIAKALRETANIERN